MNIKSMLMRLASALNCPDLIEVLILHPGSQNQQLLKHPNAPSEEWREQDLNQELNFVVGYDSSPHSHAALDLTLWIAYQTRLVRRCGVVVHVVYVLEPQTLEPQAAQPSPSAIGPLGWLSPNLSHKSPLASTSREYPSCAVLTPPISRGSYGALSQPVLARTEQLSHADGVLWQARCLANEWRGSLQTHLRFGTVASELRQVVEAEGADLLIVGCQQASHPLVAALSPDLSCPILGIPTGELDLGG